MNFRTEYYWHKNLLITQHENGQSCTLFSKARVCHRDDHYSVSSEISDLLLFVSHFASKIKGTNFDVYFLMCVLKLKLFG